MENSKEEDRDHPFEKAERNLSPVFDGKEHCPACGLTLQAVKCKLTCECGYFMSCSDF